MNLIPVSYTHLDVYKRQILGRYKEWLIKNVHVIKITIKSDKAIRKSLKNVL